ncbi:hypothetical protein BJX63DRAFT_434012 [Aspergillus granulosus]|uniref:Uncharacterized protein n=1 Tax=Aspergillus granulosus TaxID=176169 RepID=A0ABR4H5N5_9EURO
MQPPMDSRTKAARDNFLKLGVTISPLPAAEDKWAWRVEKDAGDMSKLEHLEAFFEGCQFMFDSRSHDEQFISRRLPTILLGVLVMIKKACLHIEDQGLRSATRRPHWFGQQMLKVSVLFEGKREIVETTVDYTLVYGRREKLAFNLVVLRENSLEMQDKTWEALTAMGAAHRARAVLGDNVGIYGIHTNSYEWHFLHLGAGGEASLHCYVLTYSALRLSWDTDKPQIIALLEKISKQAVDLAQKAG